ncbi:MAG: putative C-S lyase [Anaerolineae bacterium]|jgi:cysteine-S-conjugate beta-lyase|nr:putative C-S lyase [Anaerolineae bacterium]MBT7072203.1 putative C-S lyase [Anaerolineae bacterium]MBT7324701.1 putative C-S lyase [Anaerolineae bacterium]
MPSKFDEIIDRRSKSNSIKWHAFPEDTLPMWVADMDFAAPPAILGALHGAIGHGVLGYEFPSKQLQESVAKRMQKLYSWDVKADDVVPVPGLVTGFNIAASIGVKPSEGILIQTPVYPPFMKVQKNTATVTQIAELKKVTNDRTLHYEVDWDVFESAVHSNDAKTSMFLFCNPHNPTGTIYSDEDLKRMVDICEREDILICSDEIHSELLLDGNKFTPIANISPEAAQRTITLIAASKTFNVAGLFVGFAIIQNESIRRRFMAESEKMTLHTNTFGHIAAEVGFSGVCDGWLEELLAYLTDNRNFLVDYVKKNFPGVKITNPESTFLAWLDFSELIEQGKVTMPLQDFFIEKGKIAINDGPTFGPGGGGFVRLNFGCPRETLIEGLERIKAALA